MYAVLAYMQKGVLDPLELKSQAFVSHYVGAGTEHGSLKESTELLAFKSSIQPSALGPESNSVVCGSYPIFRSVKRHAFISVKITISTYRHGKFCIKMLPKVP